jgi:hypothetical protein
VSGATEPSEESGGLPMEVGRLGEGSVAWACVRECHPTMPRTTKCLSGPLARASCRAPPPYTRYAVAVTIREARDHDAEGIARLSRENAAYYVQLAPEYFRLPAEEEFVEFIEDGREWREGLDNLALVADDDGTIA